MIGGPSTGNMFQSICKMSGSIENRSVILFLEYKKPKAQEQKPHKLVSKNRRLKLILLPTINQKTPTNPEEDGHLDEDKAGRRPK